MHEIGGVDKNRAILPEELKNQDRDLLARTLIIELPCQLFERVKRDAKENGMDAAGVLIEALDTFLRKQD
jgi:hypothetical protein